MTIKTSEIYKSMISAEDKIALHRLEKATKFISENAELDKVKEHVSNSKKYVLVVTPYKTSSDQAEVKTWNYTLGQVYSVSESGERTLISEVQRNYHSFQYAFVEGHSNGHDYLICGEHYQGQTIIELDTGEKASWIPPMGGFCWINARISPSTNLLAVDGCYWACPYEIKMFDFSNPLKVPFDCLNDNCEITEFYSWNEDDSCNVLIEYETRKSDGKSVRELSEEEQDDLESLVVPGINFNEIYGFERKNIIWHKP